MIGVWLCLLSAIFALVAAGFAMRAAYLTGKILRRAIHNDWIPPKPF